MVKKNYFFQTKKFRKFYKNRLFVRQDHGNSMLQHCHVNSVKSNKTHRLIHFHYSPKYQGQHGQFTTAIIVSSSYELCNTHTVFITYIRWLSTYLQSRIPTYNNKNMFCLVFFFLCSLSTQYNGSGRCCRLSLLQIK